MLEQPSHAVAVDRQLELEGLGSGALERPLPDALDQVGVGLVGETVLVAVAGANFGAALGVSVGSAAVLVGAAIVEVGGVAGSAMAEAFAKLRSGR